MNLRALIFDFDGTVADTEETHRQAFNYAFLRFGLRWDWSKALYRELLKTSGGKERIDRFIARLPVSSAEKARLCQLVPAIHRTKTQLYTELIGDGRCPLRPGVTRLLAEARQAGLRLAIASTSTAANVNALLTRHLGGGGVGQFYSIVCGDLVQRKKPAPDIYQLALSTLGLPSGACIAFEDSLNGLSAAKAAALFTVVTPSQWTAGDDFADADLELSSLGDSDHPLSPEESELVGGAWLGLAQLSRLHAATARERTPSAAHDHDLRPSPSEGRAVGAGDERETRSGH
jgi:HAD superfamily hydrolase (TIGR01509 family)